MDINIIVEMIWTSIDWADIQITLYGDDEVYHMFGKESCLISLSHRGEFDWMIGFIVSASFGFLEVRIRKNVCVQLTVCNNRP